MESDSLRVKFRTILERHVPSAAVAYCLQLWIEHPFNFKVKKSRLSKLGDYRYHPQKESHTVTVNHDLNPYAFLITYLHEVAHLITFKAHGRRVRPHGNEWKNTFKKLVIPVLTPEVFPPSLIRALTGYLKNPKASSCSDHNLLQALSVYDSRPKTFLSEIQVGSHFRLGNKIFEKEQLRRTRYVCREVSSGRRYLISKSAQVEPSHA